MTLNKEKFARFGLSSIGFVYILVGILTGLSALNLGGRQTGTKGAIGYLAYQPIGKFLVAVVAIGLFSYAFWRLHQSFMDSRHLGADFKALFTRGGYLTGAIFYGFLGIVALKLFLGSTNNNKAELVANLLNSTYGSILTMAFGIILAGKAIYEIYYILSGKFKKNVNSPEITSKVKSLILKLGIIGHGARSIVFGIMAFLTVRAGVTIRNEEVSTVKDAFQFLNFEFGALILSGVAIGIICYGLFMMVKAKYLYINID